MLATALSHGATTCSKPRKTITGCWPSKSTSTPRPVGSGAGRSPIQRDGRGDACPAWDSADQPYFRRQFDPKTSKDVRLFLDGGDDDAVVSGRGGGPRVRILGGDGRDRLADSSRGGHNKFYDDPAGPARTAGSPSKVDRRPYTAPRKSPTALPARDWGHRWIATTTLSFGPDIGLLVGGGRTLTTYGFRKNPYASRHRFRAALASGPKTYRLDYGGEFRRENSTGYAEVLVHASGIDIISFHGFGNEIAAPGNNEFYRVTQNAFTVQPSLVLPMGARASLRVGASAQVFQHR